MASIRTASALTLAALAQRQPRFVDWGIRLDRAPAWTWLALQAAALAPAGIRAAGALQAGWGEAAGFLAMAAFAFFAWRTRRRLRASPGLGWLSLGALASVSAIVPGMGFAGWPAPPWAAGPLVAAALSCSAAAFLPHRMAFTPHALIEGWFDNRFVNRIVHKALFGLAMLLCLGGSAWSALDPGRSASASAQATVQGQTMCTFERLVDVKKRTFVDTPT